MKSNATLTYREEGNIFIDSIFAYGIYDSVLVYSYSNGDHSTIREISMFDVISLFLSNKSNF